ncbi:hypothetical protein F383_02823 [Gossypium arboreum]|uniref:Uncharacterized protein n=1 Tax=Gossypium arboreum TaxID=29729 RepID=A0A0B0MKX7_GOSAR|nr:hypothetical protein F383_02823 [Gossypium arboreum]
MRTQALILPLYRLTLEPVPKGLFCAENKVHVKTLSDDRRNEDLGFGPRRDKEPCRNNEAN